MQFASDNTSGAAPRIMAALAEANAGYAPSYGSDALTTRVRDKVRQLFQAPQAEVFLVPTGTAANALSAALLCPQWGAIYCHDAAHVEVDECGAPEFFIGGGRTAPVAGAHGKITAEGLQARMAQTPEGDVHHVQHGMLTLTNLTEAGTAYSPAEIATLTAIARAAGMASHLDGSRLANALVATGASPADMTWRAGVDVLSLGATKNGCLGVEAVVLFDPARAWELQLRRKRAGHLISKHRFLAAQMLAWLEDGLWLTLAAQANRMAARLAAGIAALPHAALVHPCQGNILFATLPRATHAGAMAAGAYYYLCQQDREPDGPGDAPLMARFVCSWSTTEADVDALLAALR